MHLEINGNHLSPLNQINFEAFIQSNFDILWIQN